MTDSFEDVALVLVFVFVAVVDLLVVVTLDLEPTTRDPYAMMS